MFMAEAVASGGSKDPKTKVAEMVAMVMPPPPAANAGGAGAGAARAGEPSAAPPSYESHQGAGTEGRAGAAAAEEPRLYSLEELRAMPVRELKRLMTANDISAQDAVEKEEFVQLLFDVQQGVAEAPP